jgi:hypothetical protein
MSHGFLPPVAVPTIWGWRVGLIAPKSHLPARNIVVSLAGFSAAAGGATRLPLRQNHI